MNYFTSRQRSSQTLYAGPYNNGNHIAAGNFRREIQEFWLFNNKDNGKDEIRTLHVRKLMARLSFL